MVMQHDVIDSNSSVFVISRFDDEADVIECYESLDISTRSATRDTSNTSRDFDLDNTREKSRQSAGGCVYARDSILNFSKDEDDDEDENDDVMDWKNNSILFGDLHSHPSSLEKKEGVPPAFATSERSSEVNSSPLPPPAASVATAANLPENASRKKPSIMEGLTLYSVTDSFVDSLCNSTACVLNNGNSTVADPKYAQPIYPSSRWEPGFPAVVCGQWQRRDNGMKDTANVVSMDVWQLLGCSSTPAEGEVDEIWSLETGDLFRQVGKKQPMRANINLRLKRIHGLRMDRISGASRHGVTIANCGNNRNDFRIAENRRQPLFMDKSYSMLDDPLADFIGAGIEPIPIDDDGYDSDPEINCSSNATRLNPLSPQIALGQYEIMPSEPLPCDDKEMFYSVQRTLNCTWTLTWHPNPDNMQEYDVSHKAICVNIWMERGTVVTNSGVVVEPAFMWRDAYQPHLAQHKLNASTQKPWSMRLLNACRIIHCADLGTLDRKKYPLARLNSSLLLKCCKGQEFLLEANGPEEARTITERWKLAVARFASLAVTEDVNAIAKEFFHPTLDSQLLTVPEDL